MTKPFKPVGVGDSTAQIRGRSPEAKVHKKSSAKVQSHEGEPEVDKTPGTDYADRIDPRTVPKSLNGQQSPLTDLIDSGWHIFAKLYGIEGQQGGLQLQLAALGGAEAPEATFSAESRKATARQFVSLGFNREDAKKLVDSLAFVFAATHSQADVKKTHRELKIQHEIDAFRKELVEIKKTTTPDSRDAKIAAAGEQLLGKANQIGGRLEALLAMREMPKELQLIENRVRAVFDIVKIVSRHFLGDAAPA